MFVLIRLTVSEIPGLKTVIKEKEKKNFSQIEEKFV